MKLINEVVWGIVRLIIVFAVMSIILYLLLII